MLIPRLHPFVFVEGISILEIRTACIFKTSSHIARTPIQDRPREDDNGDAVFERRHEKATVDLFEYERALDVLMCAP